VRINLKPKRNLPKNKKSTPTWNNKSLRRTNVSTVKEPQPKYLLKRLLTVNILKETGARLAVALISILIIMKRKKIGRRGLL
jgi:hypothetical protein